MNNLLMKYKPSDKTAEEWERIWQSSSYVLEPLRKVLEEMKTGLVKVDGEAFDTPNHYAQLVAALAKEKVLDRVIALLPK